MIKYLVRIILDAAIGSIALVVCLEAAQWADIKWRHR